MILYDDNRISINNKHINVEDLGVVEDEIWSDSGSIFLPLKDKTAVLNLPYIQKKIIKEIETALKVLDETDEDIKSAVENFDINSVDVHIEYDNEKLNHSLFFILEVEDSFNDESTGLPFVVPVKFNNRDICFLADYIIS